MSEFRFAHPIVFVLFVLVAGLSYLRSSRRNNVLPPVLLYSDVRLLENLPVGWRVRFRRLPDILRLLAWGGLVVALARPQVGDVREIIQGEGIDIVMTLDISASMSLPDFDPNRLEAAKLVIGEFVQGRAYDRIGLVVFASDAFYQSPPTLDYQQLNVLLNEVQLAPELGLEEETAIGSGIASAVNMLRDSVSQSRVIVLITDGANNTGMIDPATAVETARTFGIKIYTIGIGRAGEIGFVDESGRLVNVNSDLDESTLQNIANRSGGKYFHAADLDTLQEVYDQIDVLERSEVNRQILVRWQDAGWTFVLVGLICLLFERLLRESVFQAVP